jgi:hypothetical protein
MKFMHTKKYVTLVQLKKKLLVSICPGSVHSLYVTTVLICRETLIHCVFRYYGWQSFVVKDKVLPYDFLPFAQTITKTKIYEVDTLPNQLSNDDCQQFIERIKPQLEDSLVFEFNRNM